MVAPIKASLVEKNYVENDSNLVFKLPVNMMSDYFEGDDSTAIFPIDCKGNIVMVVLDGGAGVSIIAKHCWERIG